ncbi:putative disease resistance protein RGA3 isoform X1 [Panicum miliaceum]|uniref:Disease resistance protein RGA3 isoform X1 n=1 Tax=Panicum miliaceum TaxID=4540 RepID=A0A3L6RBZ6_PANMI|nr:putative disease resistance protein RGA3 isoform X1 [Panicum miliaceum]
MSFGRLCALSFLSLSKCSELKELPESIRKLQSLRHLDMSGCCALQRYRLEAHLQSDSDAEVQNEAEQDLSASERDLQSESD